MNKEKLFRIWGKIACFILVWLFCEKVYLLSYELGFAVSLLWNPFFYLYAFIQALIYGTPLVPLIYYSFKK